ncbi:hypothetical protein T459_03685 [Capsicum annuum]|uniref:Uncharacterized protein n=1 Tax=Capsicum annuum TaxID=4072 RepID=A0A2G3ANS4_CAPAN|nr:hypothetical protein T459_03685 [Capsicum annuum]
MMTTHKAHCLILPYPVQGHVNPMLQFSERVQSKGVKITIAPTKSFLKNMQELPTSLSIEAISDGYDDGGHDQAESFVAYTKRFKEVGSDTLSQLIQKLTNCECPVNCMSCAVDNIYYHAHKGILKLPPTQVDQEIIIPALSSTTEASDVPGFLTTLNLMELSEFRTISELTVSDNPDILKNYLSSFTETE